MNQTKVNLIGAGRVGQTFLRLLATMRSIRIQDVHSARYASAHAAVPQTGAGRAVEHLADMRPADLWIIAVPDTRISTVASQLAQTLPKTGQNTVAFHCSGFFPAAEMAPLRALNWHLASVHPVLSFADPERAKDQFNGALCGLEGDEDAVTFVQPILEHLGAECFRIRSEGKSLYHAAAVISNNFTVVLQAIACEAWAEAGVEDNVVPKLNATLLQSTVENVIALGPQDALTGPAARGDENVVVSQGQDVAQWHPAAGDIYRTLSLLARSLKDNGSTRADAAGPRRRS